MNKYEIMFIVRPDIDDAAVTAVVEQFKKILTDNKATINEEKALGQKELAYEIKDHKAGKYFLLNLEAKDSKAVEEFDRLSLINDNIIRHLIIRENN